MLRALIFGLTILHLGPGIAFALLAFGCEAPVPVLGALCGRRAFSSFGLLTAGSWVCLLVGAAAVHLVQRARRAPSALGRRVQALCAVLAAGALLGTAGAWLTGSQYAFLAIPGALVVGWWFLADPLACAAGTREGRAGDGPRGAM